MLAVVPAQPRGDHGPPVAALGQVGGIAQHLGHQGVEQPRGRPLADGPRGLGREAEARQRRDHQVEGVRGLAPEPRGERQLLDGLPELVVRPRPAVGDDQRPLAARLAHHVQEVQVEILHPGGELGEPVQVRHGRAPVVGVGPVRAERLEVLAVAAIGPSVGNLRLWRPRIGAHLVQHRRHLGLGPGDLEGFDLSHGAPPELSESLAAFPQGASSAGLEPLGQGGADLVVQLARRARGQLAGHLQHHDPVGGGPEHPADLVGIESSVA